MDFYLTKVSSFISWYCCVNHRIPTAKSMIWWPLVTCCEDAIRHSQYTWTTAWYQEMLIQHDKPIVDIVILVYGVQVMAKVIFSSNNNEGVR